MPTQATGWGADWGTDWGGGDYDFDVLALIRRRIWTVLRGKPQFEAAIAWIAEQLQTAEEIAELVRYHKGARTAVGVTLEAHGVGLGQPRDGMADDDYQKALVAVSAGLFREKTTELALELLRIVATDTNVTTGYRDWLSCAYEYTFRNINRSVAPVWDRILRRAKPDGVSMHTQVVEVGVLAFAFDGAGPGYDEGRYAYTLDGD